MGGMRSIEIDFDVHKKIEGERRSFDETPNVVLRRLLGIRGEDVGPIRKTGGGKPWTSKGVTLPDGTELRMTYNSQVYSGKVVDGQWKVGENYYNSPSDAAGGVARTKAGGSPSLNGWLYWKAKCPGESEWIEIQQLRNRVK